MSKNSNHNNEANSTTLADRSSNARKRVTVSFKGDPGRTEQSHKDMCDIAYIIQKHTTAGVPLTPPEANAFNDLSTVMNYQDCLNTVLSIDEKFSSLPSAVRKAFNHDPAALLAALDDPNQTGRLVELGVLTAKDGRQNNQPEPVAQPEKVIEPPKAE